MKEEIGGSSNLETIFILNMLLIGSLWDYFKSVRPLYVSTSRSASVYLVSVIKNPFDMCLPELVVVKLFNKSTFYTEIDMGKRFSGYDITPLYYGHCIFSDGSMVSVQEYIEGEELFHKIQRRELVNTRYIAKTLLTTLFRWHQEKVYHRDIKPENIIVTSTGSIKIIDFDLSCDLNSRKGNFKTRCGTYGYLYPEYLDTYTYISNESRYRLYDLWAAAMLIATCELHFTPQIQSEDPNQLHQTRMRINQIKDHDIRDLILIIMNIDPCKPFHPKIRRMQNIISHM